MNLPNRQVSQLPFASKNAPLLDFREVILPWRYVTIRTGVKKERNFFLGSGGRKYRLPMSPFDSFVDDDECPTTIRCFTGALLTLSQRRRKAAR